MDLETARENMIEQQIRPWNVLELQTLNAMAEIRREDFVPADYRHLAFADIQIPIGDGEVMLEPKVGARMVENLGLEPGMKVCEIGTGTGFLTAVMATLCANVTSVEIDPELSADANRKVSMAGVTNYDMVVADCFDFIREMQDSGTRFDAVLVTGSVPDAAEAFSSLVTPSGCIVAPEGSDPCMQVVRIGGDGSRRSIFDTSIRRLKNVQDAPQFTF